MPSNTNIVMIRHAEKPDSDSDPNLAVAGQERAQAYTVYFQNYPINGATLKFDFLFACTDSSKSDRPVETITPLANAINLPINQNYADKDFKELADEIRHNPQYDQKNILICWHHGEILDLAKHLLHGTVLPVSSNWPKHKWPGAVFGWVLQLCYDSSGNIAPSQTICLNQRLMFDVAGYKIYAARFDTPFFRRFVFKTSRKKGAVRLVRFFATSSGVPVATTSPPSAPASGPISTM
jgi:hypothetical protein